MSASGPAARTLTAQRHALVHSLRDHGHLREPPVIEAMLAIPREEFVPASAREKAYEDHPLIIGEGQTISAPHMVAIMSEALQVRTGDRILEIGTGSGYQAAILGRLAGPGGRVLTIERHRALSEAARRALDRVGAGNVITRVGDGSKGDPDGAPYDRIVVTAAAPRLPPPLVEQLAIGGILLAPVGRRTCHLIRARKTDEGLREQSLGLCAFVPLKGAHGHRRPWLGP